MIAIYLLGLLAVASAAPHYQHHHYPGFHHNHHGYPNTLTDSYFRDDNMFDTGNFWQGIADEMHRLDEMLNDFNKHFPGGQASEGIQGNDYVISITLTGFDEKDIVVKAREGLLMIQASHKSEVGNQKSYLDLRSLPKNINVAGSWTYDKGVLKIVFPVTNKAEDTTEAVTEAEGTQAPENNYSREEMETNVHTNQDADVGITGNQDENSVDFAQNSVEATTYAVDLKNEIEFVPVSRF